jgi:hypothetical protein
VAGIRRTSKGKITNGKEQKMSIIENCVSIKRGIRERLQSKRPVLGNGHRLAWFLSCAKKRATNKKEVLAAFRKGIRAWKLFERKTAAYHVEKFFFSQLRDEEKPAPVIMQEAFPNRKTGYKKRRMGKSDHKTSEDGDGDSDPSIQNGGVVYA